MSETMYSDEVKTYLKNHPEFFEENAALLADIHLPSPHGNGTISLAERQQLAQRDKINVLENRFSELVLNAQQNDAIANKIHTFNLRLHQAKHFDATEQLISHDLPEFFDLSDTCLRIWANPITHAHQANLVFGEMPDLVKTWVTALTKPYCGKLPEIVGDDWFIDAPASLAIVPLKGTHTFGFLALASDDSQRFYSEMGTEFLTKLGEIVSAAFSKYLEEA